MRVKTDPDVVADRHVVRRTPSEELGFVLAQPVAPGAVEESEEGTDLEVFMRLPVIAPAEKGELSVAIALGDLKR